MALHLSSGVFFEPVDQVSGTINPASVMTLFVAGITERGPIGEAPVVTSFPQWKRIYGGYMASNYETCAAVKGFFDNGGSICRTSRITHCTVQGDPSSTTSAAGTLDLETAEDSPSAGSTQSGEQPFNLEPDQTIDVEFEAGGVQTFTITATAAEIESDAEVFTLANGMTLIFDGVTRILLTGEFVDITNATAEEVVAILNPFFLANSIPLIATLTTGDTKVAVTSIQRGSGATFDIDGTALAALGGTFAAGTITGTGNVADIDAVTAAEIVALSTPLTDGVVSAASGRVRYTSNTTGLTSTAQIKNTSTATGLGFDNAVHTGSDGTPVVTWTVDGKYDGEYANALSPRVSAPTNGDALSVNLEFLKNGTVVERFPNVSADPDSARFVETIVNDANTGSQLFTITDQGVLLPPATGTFGPLTGGDDGLASLADADYLGAALDGPPPTRTGIHVFDDYDDGDVLIIPGRATAAVAEGAIGYCEVDKLGELFYIPDLPFGYSDTEAIDYATSTTTLYNRSGVGAMYWPWIKVVNPDPEVFTEVTITVPPSGAIAGLYARVEQAKIGGATDQPAGLDNRYLLVGVLGVDTPTGQSPSRAVSDRLFPVNINPIKRQQLPNGAGPWYVDGARTLSITGQFPSVGQSRGSIFIKKRLRSGLDVIRQRNINADLWKRAARIAKDFLNELTRAGAFKSKKPEEAFLVDFGEGQNPPAVQAAREVRGAVGVALSAPAEFVVIPFGPLSDVLAAQEATA